MKRLTRKAENMESYIGREFQFLNHEWKMELENDDINIKDGTLGTITNVEVDGDDFESTYFEIKLENGAVLNAMSGYHLELTDTI